MLVKLSLSALATNLRVHISPVGFQFKRVTEPLIQMQADKAYLVTRAPNDDASKYYDLIKKELKEKYSHINLNEVFLDIWDPYECIEKFRQIILEEQSQGNHVYVNVASGTKITAITGMLSCMLWGGHPYYAKISYPGQSNPDPPPSEFVEEAQLLPVYEIRKPREEYLLIMGLLKTAGGTMRKGQIIRELETRKVIRLKDESKSELSEAAKQSQLRALLDPMQDEWDYIRVDARGRRSEVTIRPKGETALRIFGTPKILR